MSPIPERREANSPLPPVPMVPPPDKSPGSSSVNNSLPIANTAPPVYAQVNKKKKVPPATLALSNESTSSQSFVPSTTTVDPSPQTAGSSVVPSTSSTCIDGTVATQITNVVPRSRHTAKLMDSSNTNPSKNAQEPLVRRWSKADISYSEFEIVRENLAPNDPISIISEPTTISISPIPIGAEISSSSKVPSTSFVINSSDTRSSINITNNASFPIVSPSSSAVLIDSNDLLDEDNYNVIPERNLSRLHARAAIPPPDSDDNQGINSYQELEPVSNPYHEIRETNQGGIRLRNQGHYQEIGDTKNGCLDVENIGPSSNLYQEITKPSKSKYDGEDDEDDDEDDFYEKVKPTNVNKKKHGYEKLKKKPSNEVPPVPVSSSAVNLNTEFDDDEEDDDGKDGDSLYERVRYPPYERLKESRSDLAVYKNGEEEEEDSDSNLYEAIGYSKVKPKTKKKEHSVLDDIKYMDEERDGDEKLPTVPVNVDQLYARVDKSKKKKSKESEFEGNNDSKKDSSLVNKGENRKSYERSNLPMDDDESGSENATFNSIEYI